MTARATTMPCGWCGGTGVAEPDLVEACTGCRICAGNAVLLRPRERKP